MLSFEVEEFDMPLEYRQTITMDEQMEKGREGLAVLIPFWGKYDLPCTLFTTALFALQFPDTIRELSQKHEIASHTFYHSKYETAHLLSSRLALENITGKPVTGLRMPRMRRVEMTDVLEAGYQYDSSINPTYIPGRYNNFKLPATVYREGGITRVPASVSPVIRLPLFWLAFKNYPYPVFLALCRQTLKKHGYLCLYFHPWEFINLDAYKIPRYTKKISGKELLTRLERLVNDLAGETEFNTIQHFLSSAG